jgi:hypothetical protein
MKIFATIAFCLSTSSCICCRQLQAKNPVEKVNRSLSVVEKKVRNAAVKVVTSGVTAVEQLSTIKM